MNVNLAWETVVTSITPGNLRCAPNDELKEAGDILQNSGLAQIVEEWFLENLKDDLQSSVSKKFWAHFSGTAPEVATQNISRAFEELDSSMKLYQPCLLRLQFLNTCFISVNSPIPSLANHIQMLLKASVFFKSTKVFQDAILQFYTRAFQVFLPSETDVDEPEELCSRCHDSPVDRESCTCADIMSAFHILNQQLNELGLLEWLAGDAITNVIHQKISLHVKHTCSGNFEMNFLDKLEKWLEVKVLGWLNLLYNPQGEKTKSTEAEAHVQAQKGRLYHYMYETYAGIRIDELFNIIVEFPESEPALQDLKSCLEKTDLRSKLVTSLKTALETRLLHPGVNTGDILTAYISAIRALRMLDPTGVLLELVCDPVRRYLRCRDDTVRCIVSSLTEDGGNELSDELIKAQPLKMDDSCHSDDDMEDWESWMPDPVDADPGKVSRRSSDIISMLVNIYGSKELFVNEYRTLLADRILSQFNYDTEKEIRYLELLKLRFGESQLHYCEVMLKDVADSRRINQHILEQRKKEEQTQGEIAVNAMILSAQFWPTFREEKLDLPPQLQEALENYTKSYETLKGNRTLNWKPHLGLVDIEIELKDKTLTFNVSPIHATIIMHFQDKAKWTVEELSSVMHMPTAAIRRKITFWQSQGLLREESTDTFLLVEEQRGKGQGQEVIMMEEEDTESAMASQEDQREEELQVFWSYIVGMLTNLESLPLERIHSILKMFAMQGPSTGEVSLQELKAFLDRKVKEQKLIYAGGVYRLPKTGT